MITEKEVFEYLMANAELKLGRPCTDFGSQWRKENNYKGPLTLKAMGRELWNKYCKDRYNWKKQESK